LEEEEFQVSGFRFLVEEEGEFQVVKFLVSGFKFQVSGSRFQVSGFKTMSQETRNQKPETRNKKPGTRNQEQETRNKKPGTRNQEQETRNKKPETRNSALPLVIRHSSFVTRHSSLLPHSALLPVQVVCGRNAAPPLAIRRPERPSSVFTRHSSFVTFFLSHHVDQL
jgi:hypothetical protein